MLCRCIRTWAKVVCSAVSNMKLNTWTSDIFLEMKILSHIYEIDQTNKFSNYSMVSSILFLTYMTRFN